MIFLGSNEKFNQRVAKFAIDGCDAMLRLRIYNLIFKLTSIKLFHKVFKFLTGNQPSVPAAVAQAPAPAPAVHATSGDSLNESSSSLEDSLELDLSDTLMKLQMDTLPLDCSIFKESFGNLVDL